VAQLAAALLAALALGAAAQSPMPYSGEAPAPSAPPAASTAPAVAASTEPATAEVVASTGGVHVAGETKAVLKRPIRATIHKEAKDWEPLSLRAGGDPEAAENGVVLRQEKVRKRWKGERSPAKSRAYLVKDGEDRWLVVAVFPRSLARRRAHFEIRLRLVEGFVEDARVTLVKITDRRTGGATLSSEQLIARGVAYEEDSPASGEILISALDPRASKKAFNAGTVRRAAFADADARLASISWSAQGVQGPQ
jgi:hypothetical protein